MFTKTPVVRLFVLVCVLIVMPQMASAAKKDNTESLRKLALQICANYSLAGAKIAEDSKAAIQRYMARYEGITNSTGKQMLLFLNKNKHKMTCRRDGVEKYYMMVAFDRSAHGSLFEELFFDDLTPDNHSVIPDVNAVSYTGPHGAPETVLDYMDNLIKTNKGGSAYTAQVKELRDTFIEHLSAKRFDRLPAKEQKTHQRMALLDVKKKLATARKKLKTNPVVHTGLHGLRKKRKNFVIRQSKSSELNRTENDLYWQIVNKINVVTKI